MYCIHCQKSVEYLASLPSESPLDFLGFVNITIWVTIDPYLLIIDHCVVVIHIVGGKIYYCLVLSYPHKWYHIIKFCNYFMLIEGLRVFVCVFWSKHFKYCFFAWLDNLNIYTIQKSWLGWNALILMFGTLYLYWDH